MIKSLGTKNRIFLSQDMYSADLKKLIELLNEDRKVEIQ